jgi:putative FmdB family regulatory protein
MPYYEYRCEECGRKALIQQSYEEYGRRSVSCPNCGSEKLERLISRVRFARSEGSRLDDLGDLDSFGDLDENDPRSMARMMRKMSAEMGEEMPPEFEEVVGRLEAGESPDEIEQRMPDLGAEGDDFGFEA